MFLVKLAKKRSRRKGRMYTEMQKYMNWNDRLYNFQQLRCFLFTHIARRFLFNQYTLLFKSICLSGYSIRIAHPRVSHSKEPILEIRNKYSQERNCKATVPIYVCIPVIDLPILLREICGLILGIYKSLTDTWMYKLGLRPRNSQKRNT